MLTLTSFQTFGQANIGLVSYEILSIPYLVSISFKIFNLNLPYNTIKPINIFYFFIY